MTFLEKIAQKAQNNYDHSGVLLAFLGDSVTQGCFEVYEKEDGSVETVFDPASAYSRLWQEMFFKLYPSVPVNILNAGISGDSAPHGLARLERDVLCHTPDLTVVCFGLNDCQAGREHLENYTGALRGIFAALQQSGSEVIFMTPNMMNTKISCHIEKESIRQIARHTMALQNDGVLDDYVAGAKQVCQEMGVAVCDCYAKWKTLEQNGVDVTELLSNKINHPTREMNRLFASSLMETVLQQNKA